MKSSLIKIEILIDSLVVYAVTSGYYEIFVSIFLSGIIQPLHNESRRDKRCQTSPQNVKPFNAWCPLKGHTYLNKPVAFSLQVFLSMSDLLVETRH